MELTSENQNLAPSALKSANGKFDFADMAAIAALVVALLAPAFELCYASVERLSILQGCWELNSDSLNGVCIGLVILPIIYLIVHRSSYFHAHAYWVLCLAGIVSIGVYTEIVGDAPRTLSSFLGAFPIYSILCLGGILVSTIKDTSWHAPISSAIFSVVGFLCFYTLPFLSTNDFFFITGSQILDIRADAYEIWPKAFLFCPLISAILALLVRARIGRVISAVVLLLPWLIFLATAPDNWEFSRAMGLYLLCAISVAATACCKIVSIDPETDPQNVNGTEPVVHPDGVFLFGFSNLGAVTTAVAILLALQCVFMSYSPAVILLLCIAGYGFVAYYFRKSVNMLTLVSLGGIIVSDIIHIILLFAQQKYFESGDFETMLSMNVLFFLNRIFLIISLIGVVVKSQDLKRISLWTYLAIPVVLSCIDGWLYMHLIGKMEIDESFVSITDTLCNIENVVLVIIALTLIYLNRNKVHESSIPN